MLPYLTETGCRLFLKRYRVNGHGAPAEKALVLARGRAVKSSPTPPAPAAYSGSQCLFHFSMVPVCASMLPSSFGCQMVGAAVEGHWPGQPRSCLGIATGPLKLVMLMGGGTFQDPSLISSNRMPRLHRISLRLVLPESSSLPLRQTPPPPTAVLAHYLRCRFAAEELPARATIPEWRQLTSARDGPAEMSSFSFRHHHRSGQRRLASHRPEV